MTDWIKYDGTNKPDDDALRSVRLRNGHETTDIKTVGMWQWCVDGGNLYGSFVSHFQLKDKEND